MRVPSPRTPPAVAVPAALALAVALVAAVPGALAHVLPGHGGAVCGGEAPETTSCSTGDHVLTSSGYLELTWTTTDAAFTGTLEARLVPMVPGFAPLSYACDFDGTGPAGEPDACTLAGDPPPRGVPFAHACESRVLGGDGPGGNGAWGCRIYHASV